MAEALNFCLKSEFDNGYWFSSLCRRAAFKILDFSLLPVILFCSSSVATNFTVSKSRADEGRFAFVGSGSVICSTLAFEGIVS